VRRDWWAQLHHGNRCVAVFRWSSAETAGANAWPVVDADDLFRYWD
jgi:hypothetical protein